MELQGFVLETRRLSLQYLIQRLIMLTLAVSQIFLHVVSFFSKIGTFQFIINPKRGRWRKLFGWENVRYYFLFLISSLYTAHCILDFVKMSTTGAKIAPHIRSLQLDLTFLHVLALGFGVCVKRQENFAVKIFNELYENGKHVLNFDRVSSYFTFWLTVK